MPSLRQGAAVPAPHLWPAIGSATAMCHMQSDFPVSCAQKSCRLLRAGACAAGLRLPCRATKRCVIQSYARTSCGIPSLCMSGGHQRLNDWRRSGGTYTDMMPYQGDQQQLLLPAAAPTVHRPAVPSATASACCASSDAVSEGLLWPAVPMPIANMQCLQVAICCTGP